MLGFFPLKRIKCTREDSVYDYGAPWQQGFPFVSTIECNVPMKAGKNHFQASQHFWQPAKP